ncbi:hypothetical protein A8L51_11290 [Pantoea stewartii]|nr:hypothetical protein NS381_13505 [Pantoea stewartii]NRH24364.1 hypothetical protein [Pantoea stewartii]
MPGPRGLRDNRQLQMAVFNAVRPKGVNVSGKKQRPLLLMPLLRGANLTRFYARRFNTDINCVV